MSTTTKKSTNLSTATAHLLSIRSNVVTKVAGHASAATSELNTVSMAPSFINSAAISKYKPSNTFSLNLSNLFDHYSNRHRVQ